jgi:hypothetical protein
MICDVGFGFLRGAFGEHWRTKATRNETAMFRTVDCLVVIPRRSVPGPAWRRDAPPDVRRTSRPRG